MRRASLTDVYLTSGRSICFFWVFLYLFFFPPPQTHCRAEQFCCVLISSFYPAFSSLFKASVWWLHHYCARTLGTLGTSVNPVWESHKQGELQFVDVHDYRASPFGSGLKMQSCKFTSSAILKYI